jgi:uncharacterized protein (TIGR03435 family)
MTRSVIVVVVLALAAAPLVAQTPDAALRFEVASIRPSRSGESFGYYRPDPGRLSITNMSVVDLVGLAYRMPINRVVGSDWLRTERYNITATFEAPSSGSARWAVMLQNLLVERFALRQHRETRPTSVYVLATARSDGKLGPQLVAMTECVEPPRVAPGCGGLAYPSVNGGVSIMARRTWAALQLAEILPGEVGRIVVDETKLSGWFDVRLQWATGTAALSSTAPPADVELPSLFTALREQLGLKLEAAERPVEMIVIDTAERPTGN